MDELIPVFEDLAVEVRLDKPEHVLEQSVERRLIGSHGRDAELAPLQEVLTAHLGRGNLELVPDPGLQTLDDHALLFEAATGGQSEVESGVGEDHRDVRRET